MTEGPAGPMAAWHRTRKEHLPHIEYSEIIATNYVINIAHSCQVPCYRALQFSTLPGTELVIIRQLIGLSLSVSYNAKSAFFSEQTLSITTNDAGTSYAF